MKKQKLLILSLSSLLMLAGCGESTSSSTSSSEDISSSSSSVSTSVSSSNQEQSSSSSSPTSDASSIKNGNEDCITLLDIPSSPKEGDSITFGYKVKSGYEFKNEVRIISSSGDEISFTDNNDGTYTFVMPSGEVTITLATRNKLYKINKDSETSKLIRLIKCEYTLDYLDNEEYSAPTEDDIWSHDSKAEYSRKVKVYLTSSDLLTPTGIVIPEMDNKEINLENGSDFVSFIMPNKAITIKVNSKKNTHPVTLNGSAHISLSLFNKVEGAYNPIEEVSTGDEVYLKASSSDDKYRIKDISYTYSVSYGSDVTTKLSDDDLEDGYYKISVPSLKDGTSLIFNVSEVEGDLYQDYSFVGNYFGTTVRKGNFGDAQWSQMYKLSIDTSGILTFAYDADSESSKTTYTITSVTSKTKGEAIATSENGKSFKFYYDGVNIIADSSFENSSEYITSDLYIAYKGDENTPSYVNDMYTGYCDSVLMDSSSYLTVVQLNKKVGDSLEVASCLYIDGKTKEFAREGVSVDITKSGLYGKTNFNAQGASYNVLVNGTIKYRLKQTGKYLPARILLDQYYGEYKLEGSSEVTLSLDGTGSGTYNGTACTYEAKDNSLVIKTTSKNVTITVNLTNMTYVVVSEETIANPLAGTTFTDASKISYDYEDDYGSTTYYCTINLYFKSEAICEFSFSEEYYDYESYSSDIIPDGEYPYTFDGTKVTITASVSNATVKIELSLSSDGKSLTFLNDVRGSEVKGQSLTKK